MNNYEKHAWLEFKAAGWLDENDKFKDEMQEAVCKHVLELLEVFNGEGHSGTSAPYTISLFKTLAEFKPIGALTGQDWEWHDVSESRGSPMWQNKRCGNVFKNEDGAYDIDGIVWWDWYADSETGKKSKSYFTNYQSRVPVTFPYIPKTEYKEWVDEAA